MTQYRQNDIPDVIRRDVNLATQNRLGSRSTKEHDPGSWTRAEAKARDGARAPNNLDDVIDNRLICVYPEGLFAKRQKLFRIHDREDDSLRVNHILAKA